MPRHAADTRPLHADDHSAEPQRTVTFAWPVQLGVGSWWLCTINTDTNSLFSWSDQPLVVATTLPTPTATPLPSTVTIEGATSAIPAGTALTIDITNWDSSQRLVHALVITDQGPNAGKLTGPSLVVHVVALNPAHTLVVSVTLNQNLAPGMLSPRSSPATQSNTFTTPSFTVVAAIATATPLALTVQVHRRRQRSGPSTRGPRSCRASCVSHRRAAPRRRDGHRRRAIRRQRA